MTVHPTRGGRQSRVASDGPVAVPPDGSSPPARRPGRRLRAAIVDPDPAWRARLRRLLEEEPGLEVVGECADGREALETISAERPDLVFLEVVLPDVDGLELARRLQRYVRAGIIFVTERNQYALQAFEVHALDYVLKPVRRERLSAAVGHVRALLQGRRGASGAQQRLIALLDRRDAERQRRARLLIRHPDGVFFVKADAIDWVEAAGKLVKVHTGKHVHVQRDTLAHIEQQLDPAQFVRVSRSAIVNLERIREIQPWFNGEHLVLLDDGSQVPSSRRYRAKNLRRLLGRGAER